MTREEFMDIVYFELYSDDDNYRVNRIIDAANKYAEEQTRWIPVSEGLPEIHNYCQLYLVTYKQGQICTAFYTETNGRSWWSIDGVEAWMPLPEPYQPEISTGAEGSDKK